MPNCMKGTFWALGHRSTGATIHIAQAVVIDLGFLVHF